MGKEVAAYLIKENKAEITRPRYTKTFRQQR